MSDDDFIARFERLEIPGAEFRHADHVRVAWTYLRAGGFAHGAAKFLAHFNRYVDHIGARTKFHETITWFYLAVTNERLARRRGGTWADFARDNHDLLDPRMGILRERYGGDVLSSATARKVFLIPGSDLGGEPEAVRSESPV